MCWNATTSIVSFIVGVLVSCFIAWKALSEGKRALAVLSLGWTWVVFMQLWEYFIWINPNNQTVSRYAYVFNVTQVLFLALIYLTFFTQYKENRAIAFVVVLLYMFYILYYSPPIEPTTVGCNGHLEYPWWKKIPMGGAIYLVSLILIFILLIQPFYWSMYTLAYILLLFGLSYWLFKYSVASMWCFFAVSVPMVSYMISLITYE